MSKLNITLNGRKKEKHKMGKINTKLNIGES